MASKPTNGETSPRENPIDLIAQVVEVTTPPDIRADLWVMVRMLYLLYQSIGPADMEEAERVVHYLERRIGKRALVNALVTIANERRVGIP